MSAKCQGKLTILSSNDRLESTATCFDINDLNEFIKINQYKTNTNTNEFVCRIPMINVIIDQLAINIIAKANNKSILTLEKSAVQDVYTLKSLSLLENQSQDIQNQILKFLDTKDISKMTKVSKEYHKSSNAFSASKLSNLSNFDFSDSWWRCQMVGNPNYDPLALDPYEVFVNMLNAGIPNEELVPQPQDPNVPWRQKICDPKEMVRFRSLMNSSQWNNFKTIKIPKKFQDDNLVLPAKLETLICDNYNENWNMPASLKHLYVNHFYQNLPDPDDEEEQKNYAPNPAQLLPDNLETLHARVGVIHTLPSNLKNLSVEEGQLDIKKQWPTTLECIQIETDCQFHSLQPFLNILPQMKELHTLIFRPFIIPQNNLTASFVFPPNLLKLSLHDQYNAMFECPTNLEFLQMGRIFNQPIVLSNKLQTLIMNRDFNQPITLPETIQTVICGDKFDQRLKLPYSLKLLLASSNLYSELCHINYTKSKLYNKDLLILDQSIQYHPPQMIQDPADI